MNLAETALRSFWIVLSNAWPMLAIYVAIIIARKICTKADRLRK